MSQVCLWHGGCRNRHQGNIQQRFAFLPTPLRRPSHTHAHAHNTHAQCARTRACAHTHNAHTDDCLPLGLFENAGLGFVNDTPEEGKEFGMQEIEATTKLFRDADLESGIAICRTGFKFLVTSSFKGEDVLPAGEDSFIFKDDYGLPGGVGQYKVLELELE